jgi:hypothetical protein
LSKNFGREIDTEIEMIKKQLIKIQELKYAFSMTHAPTATTASAARAHTQ